QRLLALWQLSLAVTSAIALGLVIWFIVRYTRQSDRTDELGAIPPEYLPPPDTSVSTAGTIAKKSGTLFSAQLIDLAVRHYLKIYQTREKSLFRQANYELEIIKDIQSLKSEEREVLQDIFGNPVVGARLNMESLKRNTAVARKLTDNPGKLAKDIAGAYGLRAPVPVASAWFKRAALACSIAAVLTLSPGLAVAAIVAIIAAYSLKPLTDKGLALSRYLKGLELYISMAETDRLRMLQSPEGAAKLPAPIDTNDKRQVVKLYERLLPYAIVIGKEKDWNKQLGQYYESLQESPTWMTTHSGVYNAAVFSAAVSGMHTAASYADPTSASSGSSSGGGSSGGGGGGGGGGGW
ncbi:MAG TPA: hypothetical protein VD735_05700, partial [Candidatus Saccharimonadales bacterium]|nr:hypothetical protein [Candidatus Saccharimonadales bacterium]